MIALLLSLKFLENCYWDCIFPFTSDMNIWLHQAVKSRAANAGPRTYLAILFRRLCKLIYFGIRPVFVFDGQVPTMKRNTMVSSVQYILCCSLVTKNKCITKIRLNHQYRHSVRHGCKRKVTLCEVWPKKTRSILYAILGYSPCLCTIFRPLIGHDITEMYIAPPSPSLSNHPSRVILIGMYRSCYQLGRNNSKMYEL
ncbi:unnamed protein product [Echinostoma caproni]|uniref:XPGN domain-containing protein n=1 Tax=Echinostoma caproni TaxID=27848 RepID=A0A183B2W5_9TREM|nr:unnamed protein product [Echinostoma caproni]